MSDTSLRLRLEAETRAAFAAAGHDPAAGAVELSRRPELGQFQCNGAMAVAKQAGAPPRQVAEAVAAGLADSALIDEVSIAGPGFLNLSIGAATLAALGNGLRDDPRCGVAPRAEPVTVALDFGGPNVAKAMHVGHLRSSIIGDALQRLFRFAGDRVVSDVHLGDWGLPMGMLIAELEREQPDLAYFQDGFDPTSEPADAKPILALEDLNAMYPRAAQRCRDDEAMLERARTITAALQAGHAGYRALWSQFVAVSTAALRRDFGRLGVEFDLWDGESTVNDAIPPMVARLRESGAAVESDGAWVIPVAKPEDKVEIPPVILVNSDGGYTYATTDLATIEQRAAEQGAGLALYVVDQRQELHFTQVFRAAEGTGLAGGMAMEHIGFGTVNGPDGKPFKTRAGGVMQLADLIESAIEEARKRLDEAGLGEDLSAAEREAVAEQVGVAAIRFADLSKHRLSDYVFDLAGFTRFEGRTGPYLQYAGVRIRSLLARAADQLGEAAAAGGGILPPETEEERALLLRLLLLPDAIEEACARRAPNAVCEFAFLLAQDFSAFYQACPVLGDTAEALRASRLTISRLVLAELSLVTGLLGIAIPARM